jgi:hypothetical protein
MDVGRRSAEHPQHSGAFGGVGGSDQAPIVGAEITKGGDRQDKFDREVGVAVNEVELHNLLIRDARHNSLELRSPCRIAPGCPRFKHDTSSFEAVFAASEW